MFLQNNDVLDFCMQEFSAYGKGFIKQCKVEHPFNHVLPPAVVIMTAVLNWAVSTLLSHFEWTR